jgi:hypothetical protein
MRVNYVSAVASLCQRDIRELRGFGATPSEGPWSIAGHEFDSGVDRSREWRPRHEDLGFGKIHIVKLAAARRRAILVGVRDGAMIESKDDLDLNPVR